MRYFAYGSNMNWEVIRARAPSAKFISIARLKNHRLAITRKSARRRCGVADAVSDQGHEVWGVLYEIDERDFVVLDDAEDFVVGRAQNSYTRRENNVYINGEDSPLLAWVYFAEKEDNPPLPSAEYKRLMVEGARHWQLPEKYIEQLEQIKVAEESFRI